jgi:hypothetical protein
VVTAYDGEGGSLLQSLASSTLGGPVSEMVGFRLDCPSASVGDGSASVGDGSAIVGDGARDVVAVARWSEQHVTVFDLATAGALYSIPVSGLGRVLGW